MASLVLAGDTSGSITVAAPAVAGSTTQTLVAVTGTLAPVVSGTVNAGGTNPFPSSGGPATVDFTGIPSWVKRITVMFSGVSTSGTSNWLIQLGDSGGVENTGYLSVGTFLGSSTGGTSYTAGFGFPIGSATHVAQGFISICLLNGNTWVANGELAGSGGGAGFRYGTSGDKTLSATLDRVRITTAGGTDLFDAGSINILYE